MRQADLGVGHLAVTGLATDVRGNLEQVGYAGGADGVPLRQQAARHVHRDLPVAPRAALVDPLAGAAGFAQPQVVVVPQLGGCEAVVQLHQVEIGRIHARILVCRVSGVASERVDIRLHLATLGPRI